MLGPERGPPVSSSFQGNPAADLQMAVGDWHAASHKEVRSSRVLQN